MQRELTKIFQKAQYESDPKLEISIWRTIIMRDKRMTQLKLCVFALTGFASLVALVPAFKILSSDLTQSGFYEYFSLVFGGSSILSYWKELAFSIAESLPTISIIFTLSLVFICFLSLRHLMKQIGKNARLQSDLGGGPLILSI